MVRHCLWYGIVALTRSIRQGWNGLAGRIPALPGKAALLEYADAWRNPPELPAQHNDDAIVNRQVIDRYEQTSALADDARGGITGLSGKAVVSSDNLMDGGKQRMAEALGQIIPERRMGDEPLPEGATLLNFWQWMGSDLVSNALRGAFGEYLVALAVGAADALDGVQEEWASYDVQSPDGIKIEVKTSAYIQTWEQAQFTTPRFDIEPKKAPDLATNSWTTEKKRWSDVYVFCLHHHQDQTTVNPLDLSQWTFYVLPTATLDRAVGSQGSIGISSLQRIGAQTVNYDGLRQAIRAAYAAGKSDQSQL